MKKKLSLIFTVGASLSLLSACSTVGIEDLANTNTEIQQELDELINLDHKLSEEEMQLNEQFQRLLIEDEELDSLPDKDAELLTNINDREAELEQFEEQADAIQKKADYISAYDGEEISVELIEKASEHFLDFSESIRSYQSDYQESLDFQKEYFNQLTNDETDYEAFIQGLDDLNVNYQSLQAKKEDFDLKLNNVQEKLIEINDLIPQADESLEEKTEDIEKEENDEAPEHILAIRSEPLLNMPKSLPKQFLYDSGVDIPYPEDGVKGIYTTAYSAGGDRMESLVELINTTDLNAMVIDIKDDEGNITVDLGSDNELVNEMTNEMIDIEELMETLEKNNIYPIARIVVFKDTLLAQSNPEWSFTDGNGQVWENRRRESFINPYLEEVWDYNIEVAVQAAKLGFKDIQYDYVRFPEGFENRADSLNYSHGNYADDSADVISMEYRNRAVTEFVRKSKESLMPYGVDLSVDLFGYAAVVRETPGIGQSFPDLAKEVDVISSMIYPSHWGPGNLDIAKPDLEPYQVVNNYLAIEQEIFEELGDEAPLSRPWLQDFTASYLGAGNYKNYGAAEVTAQIEALADNGVHEYLLWNAANRYSPGASYKFN